LGDLGLDVQQGFSVEMTKRVSVVGVTSSPVVRVAVYFCHVLVIAGTCAVATTLVPSLLSMLAVSGPFPAPSDFA
jgi:hypothetical protein